MFCLSCWSFLHVGMSETGENHYASGHVGSFMLSDFARAGAEWQTYPDSTGEFNGTVPFADSASVPVYQGGVQLNPAESHDVGFSAKPNEFSVDDDAANLIVANPPGQ